MADNYPSMRETRPVFLSEPVVGVVGWLRLSLKRRWTFAAHRRFHCRSKQRPWRRHPFEIRCQNSVPKFHQSQRPAFKGLDVPQSNIHQSSVPWIFLAQTPFKNPLGPLKFLLKSATRTPSITFMFACVFSHSRYVYRVSATSPCTSP